MLIHAGETQHECSECGRSLLQKVAMRTHMWTCIRVKRLAQKGGLNQQLIGVKPHSCLECGNRVTLAGNLK